MAETAEKGHKPHYSRQYTDLKMEQPATGDGKIVDTRSVQAGNGEVSH